MIMCADKPLQRHDILNTTLVVVTNAVQNVMNKMRFVDNMPPLAVWPGRIHLDPSSATIVPIEPNKSTNGNGTVDVSRLGTSTSWTVRVIPIVYASKVSLELTFCSKPFRISAFILHLFALYSEERRWPHIKKMGASWQSANQDVGPAFVVLGFYIMTIAMIPGEIIPKDCNPRTSNREFVIFFVEEGQIEVDA